MGESMHLADGVRTIAEFWTASPLPLKGGGVANLERLAKEFSQPLPDELQTYVREFAPSSLVALQMVGNPIELYGLAGDKRLGFDQLGYNRHGVTGQSIDGWNPAWFLLADEGADPIIVDLARRDTQVLSAIHGSGAWRFSPVADTVGQFLLCAAALHHAIVTWPVPFDDADLGDDLVAEAADWLFPRMRQWAGAHYEHWCGAFTNS